MNDQGNGNQSGQFRNADVSITSALSWLMLSEVVTDRMLQCGNCDEKT